MKQYTLILGALLFFVMNSTAQFQNRLDKELFSRDMVDVEQILSKKLQKGDSSQLVQYAYTLARLHKNDAAYKHYELAASKKHFSEPVYLFDYFKLAKQHHAPLHHYKWSVLALKNAGYTEIERGTTYNRFAKLNSLCINTSADEFGLTYYGKQRIFSTTRATVNENIENSLLRSFVWTDSCSAVKWTGNSTNSKDELNQTVNHIGPVFMSKSGKLFFATRSQSKPTLNKIYNLEIVYTTQADQANPVYQVLPGCSYTFSTQHPYYNESTNTLYFSSNRDGGKGGFDIYTMQFNPTTATWSAPVALTAINTAGNEVFPTLDDEGNVYYSTEALDGYGGLDIACYYAKTKTISLLDQPINSLYDDFFFQPETPLNGSFSSNRASGKGGDDIYTYTIDTTPYQLVLTVLDSATGKPLKDVSITVNGKVLKGVTNAEGKCVFTLPVSMHGTSETILFDLTKVGYANKTFGPHVAFHDKKELALETYIVSTAPVIVASKLKVGQDLGKLLNLNPIYFDLAKWNIRPDAAAELDKIVKAMMDNPTLVIELGSHTDSRASTKYNQTLSQKRAEASAQYILSKGIDPKRLTWKGYGESKLLNKCKDGVKCSEAMHSLNRRTEFRIVKL
jgi:outer membrane protein OmpA-like peptidoglycan-associated protein